MVSSLPFSTIGKRYILHEQLGTGAMGAVYRAIDRLAPSEETRTVALKRVTTAATRLEFASQVDGQDSLSTNFRVALANEYKTLASLRHPNIINVLDYGFDSQHQSYFTMTLLDHPISILQAAQDAPLAGKIDLLVAMLQALAYLHQRGVIHRDLKPANVMTIDDASKNPSRVVKVVDFGLSVLVNTPNAANSDETVSGTFAYMAPELLQGTRASNESDLYAVGVMAYEMFAGHHPFDTSNLGILLSSILTSPIDLSPMRVNRATARVIGRLLAKTPGERYHDANELIEVLCRAADYPLPPESIEIRESFLQSAHFVGRTAELTQLTGVLNGAAGGHGSAWLVGGESGVGKSRLFDEMRTLALVQGLLVLRGQAISEGSSPYQLWRDALRSMALSADLDLSEASVLKILVPDIADLLNRDVPDAPPLDPSGTQNRLLAVVAGLFARQKQPVVIILEDLHWASSESLAMLDRLSRNIDDLPLLILGSFRDDEKPDLPGALSAMQVLKLGRLTQSGIAELSGSILGTVGRLPQVVDLLQRETEGNIFFVVEVVRALAEEAGQRSRIGDMALPEKVLSGGIQRLVQRRLARVPEEARFLLQITAVIGRELDLSVLRTVDAAVDLDRWLAMCANAAVLDVQDNRWRFAHDKMREGVLSSVTNSERAELHRRVAEAIECVYPAVPEYYAALAYHWGIVGNVGKEIQFATLAGELALRNGANLDAAIQFSRALAALNTLPETPDRIQQELPLQINLGVVLLATRGYTMPEVKQAWTRAHDLSRQLGFPPQLFQVLWGLWSFYVVQSKLTQAIELARRILAQAESSQDRVQLLVGHWVMGVTLWGLGEFAVARPHLEQAIDLYNRQEDHSLAFLYGQDPCVTCLLFLGHSMVPLGYLDQGLQYELDAVNLARELDHPFSLAFALSSAMTVYSILQDVPRIMDGIEPLNSFSSEHGFPLWIAYTTSFNGWVMTRTGKQMEGIAQIEQGLSIVRMIGAAIEVPHILSLQAEAYGKAGLPAEGLKIVDDTLDALKSGQNEDRSAEAELQRVKGVLRLLLEQPEAEENLQQAIAIAQKQQAKLWELRATVTLCRLWQKQGRLAQACEMLSPVYHWFTEGFDMKDLKEAKALLDELSLK